MVCVGGNSGGGRVGFCVNFRVVGVISGLVFGCGMEGRKAGGFGEIGGPIPSDFGGVFGLGLP